jgi:hypothetical protein
MVNYQQVEWHGEPCLSSFVALDRRGIVIAYCD